MDLDIKIPVKSDAPWCRCFKHFFSWEKAAQFMRDHVDEVEWWPFSCDIQNLPESIYREFKDYIILQAFVSHKEDISRNLLREITNDFDWYHYSINPKHDEDFLDEFKDRLDWNSLYIFVHLPMNFIKRYKETIKANFTYMLMNKNYSPDEQYEIQEIIR